MVFDDCMVKGSLNLTNVKFGGNRDCDNGDIMVLVCNMILQDHMTKESRSIKGMSHSNLAAILPSYLVIDTTIIEI